MTPLQRLDDLLEGLGALHHRLYYVSRWPLVYRRAFIVLLPISFPIWATSIS